MSLPTMSELQSLRVVDLRQRLDVLGLEKAGLKAVLVKRLYDHYQETGVVDAGEGGSGAGGGGGGGGAMAGQSCTFRCQYVGIGSYAYKALPPQDEVTVSSSGVQLRVPAIIKSEENIEINIEIADVLKVQFCRGLWWAPPLMFLDISPQACERVRTSLSMKNSESFYLDITSRDETQKRVTMKPTDIDWEKLTQLFGVEKMQEIGLAEGKQLLWTSSPKMSAICEEKGDEDEDAIVDVETVDVEVDVDAILENNENIELIGVDKDSFKDNLANVIGERAEKELGEKVARYEELKKEKIDHEQKLEQLKETQQKNDVDQLLLARKHSRQRSRICSSICYYREEMEKLEDKIEHLLQKKIDTEARFKEAQKGIQLLIQSNEEKMSAEKDKLKKIDLETKILMTSETNRREIDCTLQMMRKIEEKLRCPVCLETAKGPIYKCDDDHLVCDKCERRLSKCPQCRQRYMTEYMAPPRFTRRDLKRHRWAERDAEELQQMEKRIKVLAGVDEDVDDNGTDDNVDEDVSVLDDTTELLVPTFDSWKHERVFRLIGHNQANKAAYPFGVTVGWMMDQLKFEISKRDVETSLRYLCEKGLAYSTLNENIFKVKCQN